MTPNGSWPYIVFLYSILPLSVHRACEYDEILFLWKRISVDVMKFPDQLNAW